MSSRRYVFLMGAILAAVVAALLLAVPGSPIHKKPTLGLDLRGGLEVVLKAVPPKGHALTAADLDRSVTIMRDRIDRLGVSEPDVRKQPPNEIVIQLAGAVAEAPGAAPHPGRPLAGGERLPPLPDDARRRDVLLPPQVQPDEQGRASGDARPGPEPRRDARGHRPAVERAGRPDAVHG